MNIEKLILGIIDNKLVIDPRFKEFFNQKYLENENINELVNNYLKKKGASFDSFTFIVKD